MAMVKRVTFSCFPVVDFFSGHVYQEGVFQVSRTYIYFAYGMIFDPLIILYQIVFVAIRLSVDSNYELEDGTCVNCNKGWR